MGEQERRFRALSEVRFILYLTPLPKIPACTVYYISSLIEPAEPEPEIEPAWLPSWGASISEKRLLPCGRV